MHVSTVVKHVVVGAGATLAEALALGNPTDRCPPLIRNFARKTWFNYTPHPVLEAYLRDLGYTDLGRDPRELFYRLEDEGYANIERFIEFAWINRHRDWKVDKTNLPPGYISGLRITAPGQDDTEDISWVGEGQFWENLLYHGIGSPMSFFTLQCFFEDGKGLKDLALSKSVASHIKPNDVVLNLNYDTVFELALEQLGHAFSYSPSEPSDDRILVCKPHGSLNMVMNHERFGFCQPGWLGMPQRRGFSSYSGIIPPRLNKTYSQHPVAALILAPVLDRRPTRIVMWGVGLADSDVDLLALYRAWAERADRVEIINPCGEVADRARRIFRCHVNHFFDLKEWEQFCNEGEA